MLSKLSRRFLQIWWGRELPPGVITVLLLFIPSSLALTLPMAILYRCCTDSALGADNEITAMRANGVSVMQMVRPILAGILLSLANFTVHRRVLPRTNLRLLSRRTTSAGRNPPSRSRRR
jgi:lipopolysaccharide export LptBFGC system permease protein LptF